MNDPMTRQDLAALSDEALGARLTELAVTAPWPSGASLATAVVGRLRAEAAPSPRVRLLGSRRSLGRALLLAVAVLLLVAAVAAALGAGLPGIRVFFGPAPTSTPAPVSTAFPTTSLVASSASPIPSPAGALGTGLALGRLATLDEARSATDYPVLAPSLPGLDPPAEVWLQGSGSSAVVSFVWPAGRAGPAAPGTNVGLLLSEFRGSVQPEYLQKFLNRPTDLTAVNVGTHDGYWIGGAPHELMVLAPDGSSLVDTVRLAGNVLMWTDGPLTLRLETVTDLAPALLIATSVR